MQKLHKKTIHIYINMVKIYKKCIMKTSWLVNIFDGIVQIIALLICLIKKFLFSP